MYSYYYDKSPLSTNERLEIEASFHSQDVARETSNRKQVRLLILGPLVAEIQRFSRGDEKRVRAYDSGMAYLNGGLGK